MLQIPEGVVESELFGHKAGSFTGAIENKAGILQTVNNGTVFLDEINSLSLPVQAKLLRFLESGECFPVGGTSPDILDVRIIAASNSSLEKEIEAGKFRQDLYFRLNVVPLQIPALRERADDIKLLASHFIPSLLISMLLHRLYLVRQLLKNYRDIRGLVMLES